MEKFEDIMRRGGATAIATATRFFMKDDPVHRTLRAITTKLKELEIDYAVVGGMALVAHGYDRTTEDVDILIDAESLQLIHAELDGLGYLRPFAGSKNLRDTATGVRVEFLIAGQFPGDGKPKPIPFPTPSSAGIDIDGITYLRLEKLIELKLASGLSNALRLKDLADVLELIRVVKPPRDIALKLDPSVRDKFLEYWDALQQEQPES